MSQKLANALYSKMTTDQTSGTLYADLGGRVYFGQAPDDTSLPLLVFEMITESVENTFGSDRQDTVLFQIDLYGSSKVGVVALGNIEVKLFDLLSGATLTGVTDYDAAVVECRSRNQRTMGDEAHRIMSEYEIIGSA